MEDHELITARLRLEPVVLKHAVLVYNQLSDERLWKHFPELRPKSLAELKTLYERWERHRANPQSTDHVENWTIFLREDDTPVATMQANLFADGTASLAIIVFLAHHGKGYAKEFVDAVMEHLHNEHAITSVRLEIDTHNQAGIAFAKSLGFRLAEERRDVDRRYGLFGDESIYVRDLS